MPATATIEKRFWKKVEKNRNGCWLWMGAKTHCGYGLIGGGPGKPLVRVHRLSWELLNGPIESRLCVLHKCDNPACVNPKHLFLGTQKDNALDRETKHRGNHPSGEAHWVKLHPERMARGEHHWRRRVKLWEGERNPRGRLRAEDVLTIREKYATGTIEQKELAKEYGLDPSSIWAIVRRKTWIRI